jgi:hypothetical protein
MTPFSSNAHERSCGVSLGVVYGTVLTLIPISPDAYAYTLRIRRHPTYIPSSNTHAFTRHLRLHQTPTPSPNGYDLGHGRDSNSFEKADYTPCKTSKHTTSHARIHTGGQHVRSGQSTSITYIYLE